MIQQFHFWVFHKNENTNQKDKCTFLFTAALFTIAKLWKQWIKKMWYIYTHTLEYYSAIKKNEILSFATTWIPKSITHTHTHTHTGILFGHKNE